MNEENDYEKIVNALGRILKRLLSMRDSEASALSRTPDASDFYLTTLDGRIYALRKIRDNFENAMTTSLVETP